MASIRELRSRIKSVQSTKKITKAQEMIATSRIAKAQTRVEAAKPYAQEITRVVAGLGSVTPKLDHPLLTERDDPERAGILLITSDRGQCGGYNANVLREAEELIALLRSEGKTPVVFVMGRKGLGYYTFRGREVAAAWTGFSESPTFEHAGPATKHLVDLFVAGSGSSIPAFNGDGDIEGVDELHIVYTRFVSMLSQTPEVRRMAPVEVEVELEELDNSEGIVGGGDQEVVPGFEFEPEAERLLGALLPKYVGTRIFAALLEAAASENAARRTAMKNATDNATELERVLSREANQLRQAQITQEISEIVGGVAALSG